MTNTIQKQTFSQPVCWISTVKRIEIQRKKASRHINGNLYHYAGNNPVKYTDPDGRVIDISDNTEEQQKKILSDIQSLTDSKLCIKDNKIEIEREGSGSKTTGTDLVKQLIASSHTVSIKIGDENQASRPAGKGVNGIGCDCSITYDGKSHALPVFGGT